MNYEKPVLPCLSSALQRHVREECGRRRRGALHQRPERIRFCEKLSTHTHTHSLYTKRVPARLQLLLLECVNSSWKLEYRERNGEEQLTQQLRVQYEYTNECDAVGGEELERVLQRADRRGRTLAAGERAALRRRRQTRPHDRHRRRVRVCVNVGGDGASAPASGVGATRGEQLRDVGVGARAGLGAQEAEDLLAGERRECARRLVRVALVRGAHPLAPERCVLALALSAHGNAQNRPKLSVSVSTLNTHGKHIASTLQGWWWWWHVDKRMTTVECISHAIKNSSWLGVIKCWNKLYLTSLDNDYWWCLGSERSNSCCSTPMSHPECERSRKGCSTQQSINNKTNYGLVCSCYENERYTGHAEAQHGRRRGGD